MNASQQGNHDYSKNSFFKFSVSINRAPAQNCTVMQLKNLIVAALAALVSADAAPEVSDSPTDVSYSAQFKDKIQGHVNFSSKNGSVLVDVDISGLPAHGGPFLYHVHKLPVPANGNCNGTLSHFNPYNGAETETEPAKKEAGDLSGRHGVINGTSIHTSYIDPYLSLNPDSKSFFANLSVVVHYNDTKRLACANITQDHVVQPENGASKLAVGAAALCAGAAALLV